MSARVPARARTRQAVRARAARKDDVMKGRTILLFLVFLCSPCPSAFGQIPSPLHGITVDSVKNLPDIVASIGNLSQKMTTRIVYDRGKNANEYRDATVAIKKVSYVMGEIVDSFYMKCYTVPEYLERTKDYVDTLGNIVDIWEIGNEINGDWTFGSTRKCKVKASVRSTAAADVAAKMVAAYDYVKSKGKVTELTLYYNKGCGEPEANEMFTWAEANIPDRMRQGLNYVLVSYYEDDCHGLQPDWPAVFKQLSAMFPNSKIGMGECGAQKRRARYEVKKQYIDRYYRMHIDLPNFVGGCFWWYFRQDMVPFKDANQKVNPMWQALDGAISGK
jgi:hypothetical protein